MSVLVLSDLHLGWEKSNSEEFKEFMSTVATKSEVDTVVLAGDIFDMWRRGIAPLMAEYASVVSQITSTHESGTDVVLLAGNHDRRMIRSSDSGNVIREEPWNVDSKYKFEQSGQQFTVAHGHKGDPTNFNDTRNEALCLTNDETGYAISNGYKNFTDLTLLPTRSNRLTFLGGNARRLDHLKNPSVLSQSSQSDRLKRINRRIKRRYSDFVIAGHTHVPMQEDMYINAGSWTGPRNTYVEVSNGKAELKEYKP
jgi:UDP-2,3-diacylglucosamine pyrophosphatase LpxH